MGIDVKQSLLDSQASSVKTMTQTQIAAYKKGIEQLTSFTLDGSLQGDAYANAKAYAQGPLTSLLTGAQLYTEKVAEVAQKIADKYSSEVGEDLNEDDLKALIKSKEAELQLETSSMAIDSALSPLNSLLTTTHLLNIASIESELTKLREKLTKLQNFSNTSDSVRSDLTALEEAVIEGYGQVSSDIAGFMESHSFPQREVQGWQKTVADEIKAKTSKEIEEYRNRLFYEEFEKFAIQTVDGSTEFISEVWKEIKSEFLEELQNNSFETILKEGPDALASRSPKLLNLLRRVGNKAAVYSLLATFAKTGSTSIAASVANSVATGTGNAVQGGQVLGSALGEIAPIVKFAGKTLSWGLVVKDFADITKKDNVVNAAVKSAGHFAISEVSMSAGGMIGTKIGTAIGTMVAPGLGTAIGAVVGFGIGVAIGIGANYIFDKAYDATVGKVVTNAINTGSKLLNEGKQMVSKGINDVGNAVSGAFTAIGSVFG